jgi:hypothetical protein
MAEESEKRGLVDGRKIIGSEEAENPDSTTH